MPLVTLLPLKTTDPNSVRQIPSRTTADISGIYLHALITTSTSSEVLVGRDQMPGCQLELTNRAGQALAL